MTKSDNHNTTQSKPAVQLYTDGACLGNPGPGGWAYILKHHASGDSIFDADGEPSTTNNRMELLAVIKGLEALTQPSAVELHSDSKYVVNGLSKWLVGWKKRGWRKADKKPLLNVDLWQKLDALILDNNHDLTCYWVAGHSGHTENEQCDQMASSQAEQIKAT